MRNSLSDGQAPGIDREKTLIRLGQPASMHVRHLLRVGVLTVLRHFDLNLTGSLGQLSLRPGAAMAITILSAKIVTDILMP
ncbi:hypothetical protein GCM10023354_14880 [Garicola koreensis]